MIETPEVAVAGVQGPLRLKDVLWMARKANRVAPLQVVRYDRVVGIEHIQSAALHAQRAFDEGRNHAKTLEVEWIRYLAGERQIKHALAKMGIEDGAQGALVVSLGQKRADAVPYFVHGLGLKEDDGLLGRDEARLHAFGVTQQQLDATTPERRLDLALEAVARVDLL